MFGTNNIINLLKLVVLSGHIQGEQPVSALLTAPPEAGKTDLVTKFAQVTGIVVLTDCTAYGIMHDYGDAIKSKQVRHLIIPDLVKPMSRGQDTVHSLIAFFNALIEEGVVSISTYAEHIGVQNQGNRAEIQVPVRCGLIATLANGVLLDGRHHWSRMGFMSRLLPISYTYNASTQLEIHRSIANRAYRADEPINLNLPPQDVEVNLPQQVATDLTALSAGLASIITSANSPERVYGFRLQKHIQRLAMASAIQNGRDIVIPEDVDYLRSLSSCINLEYCPI